MYFPLKNAEHYDAKVFKSSLWANTNFHLSLRVSGS